MSAPPTVNVARAVYGGEAPPLDDPAENLHEASKLTASTLAHDMRGFGLLERHTELRWSTTRSVKHAVGWRPVELPPPGPLTAPLDHVLRTRRSATDFGSGAIRIEQLATLLWAGYGITAPSSRRDAPVPDLRAAPSGGALYPLELYVLPLAVEGLARGAYHYDPRRHRLDELRDGDLTAELRQSLATADLAAEAAAVLVVTGVFWRSRFKYGLRGYRFTLLEAGHVVQNIVLAATALGLASCPYGGFFERRLDMLLEADGVDESALYLVLVGSAR